MSDPNQKLSVALLAVPECTASTIFGIYDLFSSVGRDWELLTRSAACQSPFLPAVVARSRDELRAANGVRIRPDATLDELAAPDILCVPELLIPPETGINGRYPDEAAWIAHAYEHGSVVASACSGTLLLAEAGLLDGREATTHWGYCSTLEKFYPSVKVHCSRVLVSTGDGQRIITSGGGTSYQDLTLFLVARFFGLQEAMHLAKVYLVDWHQNGQLPFASLARSRQYDDRIIASCQEWIAENYESPSPVAAMVRLSGLTERTFKRRFTKATGMAPIEYVHTLRLEEAKQILEGTDQSIEAIANEVGYEDTTFFRRLFRRRVGLGPREYRTRFSAMRAALQEAAGS